MQDFDIGIGREAFIGVGVAVVLGLAVGGATKPTFAELQHAPATEMAAASHDTETLVQADPGWARYGSHLPSWVLGTDALKAQEQALAPPPAVAEAEPAMSPRSAEPPAMIPARYEERPAAEPDYPSERGGIVPERGDRPAPARMEELPDPDAPSD